MSGLRNRAADFVLGVRLVLGDRDAPWGRLVLMAVGIALGTAVLLGGITVPNAVSTLHERVSGRQMPALGDRSPGSVSMLGETVQENFYDESVTGTKLQQLRPDAPAPPGVDRIPAPGELVVSPALRHILESPEGASLRARMPGHVVGVIGPEGLGGEQELFYYSGTDRISPNGSVKAITDHFGEQPDRSDASHATWVLISLGVCVLLLPVVVFVLSTARLAEVARQRRLAALRLIGAGKRQVRRIAAGENLVGAVMGVLFGWTTYLLARDMLVRYTPITGTYFPSDLQPVWWSALLVTLGVPVVTVGIVLLSLRSTVMDPLGVVRGRPSKRRRLWWRLVPPVVGVAGIVASGALSSTSVDSVYYTVLLGCSMALSLLTVPLLLPWLVEITGGKATGGPVAWQLALRRLQANGGAAARSVSTVAVVVTGVVALQTMLAPGVSGFATRDGDRRDLSVSGQQRESGPSAMAAAIDEITSLPGVESAGGGQSFLLRGGDNVSVSVADCARIERLSPVRDCRDGDLFVVRGERDAALAPGTSWDVSDSAVGAPEGRWTLGPMRELPDGADRNLASGSALLATPAAAAEVPQHSRSANIDVDVAADAPPQVIEQVRTIAAAWFDESTAYHTYGSVSGEELAQNLVRYASLLGGLLTVLLVGSSLLVSAVEQIQDGARPMAVLGAVGAPRSTLMWSAFLQNAVPLALAIGLAVPSGLVLGWITSGAMGGDLAIDLPGMGLVIGVAVVLVLVVTALTASTISRVLRPEELRTG